MSYALAVFKRAAGDIEEIATWLAGRSLSGSEQWLKSLHLALTSLSSNPHGYSIAPEGPRMRMALRQCTFKTRRGRYYRILFDIDDANHRVRILRVRAPGQRPVNKRDIPGESDA